MLTPEQKILFMACDEHSRRKTLLTEHDLSHINYGRLVSLFKRNRVSLRALAKITTDWPRSIFNSMQRDQDLLESRIKTMLFVNKIFGENHIRYLMIKLNNCFNWYHGTDVDILPFTIDDEVHALNTLKKHGYSLRAVAKQINPYKITARKKGESVDVDFYPEMEYPRFKFFHLKVGDVSSIFKQKRLDVVNDTRFWTPSIEDDVLIMALHDFSHRYVPYSSVLHVIGVIRKYDLDWTDLIKKAFDNNLTLPLQIYVHLINNYSKRFYNREMVPKYIVNDVIDTVKGRFFEKMIRGKDRVASFPFEIPLPAVLYDVFHRPFL